MLEFRFPHEIYQEKDVQSRQSGENEELKTHSPVRRKIEVIASEHFRIVKSVPDPQYWDGKKE